LYSETVRPGSENSPRREVERYARLLSHGHGADGAQVIHQIVDEIHARSRAESAAQP
jgi:hypothetical protein